MKKPLSIVFVLALVIPVALSFTPRPEIPNKPPEMLKKAATHIVVGHVDRVYTSKEQRDGYKITHFMAELTLESQEKGPKNLRATGPESDPGTESSGNTLDRTKPVYVRWFSQRDISGTSRVGSNGYHGWQPEGGERVRVYLAQNAHDGYNTVEKNQDGGLNVLIPNGFEKLSQQRADKPTKAK